MNFRIATGCTFCLTCFSVHEIQFGQLEKIFTSFQEYIQNLGMDRNLPNEFLYCDYYFLRFLKKFQYKDREEHLF